MRFPPALAAFEQHGGLPKVLYLLLPATQAPPVTKDKPRPAALTSCPLVLEPCNRTSSK